MANSDVAVFEETTQQLLQKETAQRLAHRKAFVLLGANPGASGAASNSLTERPATGRSSFFFRIMAKAEIEADATRLSKLLRLLIDNDVQRPRDFLDQVKLALFEIVELLRIQRW